MTLCGATDQLHALNMLDKNQELPGVEGPGVSPKLFPDIDKAADEYVIERNKRQEITPLERAAKKKLLDLLHAHQSEIGRDDSGKLAYRINDKMITLTPVDEKLRVKVDKAADDDDDDDAGDE